MTIIHPGLTASLTTSGHFPATGTVQVKTVTNTKGNPSESWANVSGLVDIPCAIAAAAADESRSPAYATRTHTALLDDSYPAIDPTVHRFLSSGVGYDILGVEHDSQGATTRLHLREVLH
jgi:hypothetical protein